jgi:hypothetical protein
LYWLKINGDKDDLKHGAVILSVRFSVTSRWVRGLASESQQEAVMKLDLETRGESTVVPE